MVDRLELVHFQLTKTCNLRCWFCGQWGKKGFFSDAVGEEMTFSDWENVVQQLCNGTERKPDIMLWGGEPLTYPHFDDLVELLRKRGFHLGIVTNGTQIDRHLHLLKNEFKHIYVSVDGSRAIHDQIRGAGVYDKVKENLNLLGDTSAKISITTVLSEDILANLESTVKDLLSFRCDEIILQEMIGLSQAEIEKYKAVMSGLEVRAKFIDSWLMQDIPRYDRKGLQTFCKRYDGKIVYLPHGTDKPCRSPFKHAHVAWNGNVLYCTDFYDFSAGNVKQEKLVDILQNERTRAFQKMIEGNQCATCKHCSWRLSESFYL